ncbi:MAG: fibronectin type III domain-containing protein, partial [Lachnospiraceae bacterium]|nr:fibronectin type III domain-containing protein [Lachnospiraceae bacterium]
PDNGQTSPGETTVAGKPVTTVEETITASGSEKDLEGAAFSLLQAKGTPKSAKSIKLTWKKVPGATQYIIYGAKCGKKNHFKKLTTVTKTAYTQKKLKKGTYYKYIVLAVKGEQTLTMSKTIHVTTNGGKRGNNTKVTLNKRKLSLQAYKTKKLKAVLKAKRKVSLHRAIAWESSDPAIAEVTGKGNAIKVKAKSKGTCTIYAYAQNGICASCRITVK